MALHDDLEQALDELAADRTAKVADVEVRLGDGFADQWAATYATAILRDHIRRGLANRRRYLTSRSGGAVTVSAKVTKGEPRRIKVNVGTREGIPTIAQPSPR